MIRDKQLKLVFIPLLGLLIPFLSGIITYDRYSTIEIIGANTYFIFVSFCIWGGCNWLHTRIRPLLSRNRNPFIKIFSLSAVSALYGSSIGGLLTMGWYRFSRETLSWHHLLEFCVITAMAVIVFTLIYEILFLSKERELDTKIVQELDKERVEAEMNVLRNELDPHFIFNALNTLNHLIINDPSLAYQYNNKLAQVYKYFLLNKNRELVSLSNEMNFMEDYFFLLQIRHDNKLQFETQLKDAEDRKIMILPCSLQLLLENAIKHNEFSDENPLKLKIELNGEYIKISNNTKPKPYIVNSTKIGLKNLSSRYKLICNKDIRIESGENTFMVKLPLITNA
jgi:two-component system, LytTR family, sensor kinase